MARLLSDAEKISGVHYDISSYADIVQAIHEVQQSLYISGISADEAAALVQSGVMSEEDAFKLMGTTAKEAATTIQGSTMSMKAAWQNLLVGFARDDADMEQLISDFIGSAETALSNSMPRITKVLGGISDAIIKIAPYIEEKLPELVNAIMPGLTTAVSTLMDALSMVLPELLAPVGNAAMSVLDAILNSLSEKFPALAGIFEGLITIVSVIVEKVADFMEWLSEGSTGADLFAAAVAGVVGAIAGFKISLGIVNLIGAFKKAIEGAKIAFGALNAIMAANPLVLIATLIGAVVAALIVLWNTNEDFRNAVINIGNAIKDFVTDLVDGFVKFFTETLPNALADLREFVSQKTEEIKNFFIGLRDGIMEAFSNIGAWFSEKFTAAYNAVTDAWSGAKQWASDRWTDISDAFTGTKEWFSTTFSNAWNGVKEAFGGVKTFFDGVWSDITGIFSNAKEWFKGIGKNIIDGLTEGIGGLWNGFISFLSGKTDEVKDEFEGEQGFDTHSPSKWSEKVFRNVMEGGEIGLERGLPDLLSGAENAVRGIQDALVTDPFNVSYSSGDALSGGYSYAPQLAAAGAGYGTPQFEIVIEPSQVVLDKRVVGEIVWRYVKTQQRARG